MIRCPYCGTELIEKGETLMCPNCGIIEEEQEETTNKIPSYVK